jgi:hypothetical protein
MRRQFFGTFLSGLLKSLVGEKNLVTIKAEDSM